MAGGIAVNKDGLLEGERIGRVPSGNGAPGGFAKGCTFIPCTWLRVIGGTTFQ